MSNLLKLVGTEFGYHKKWLILTYCAITIALTLVSIGFDNNIPILITNTMTPIIVMAIAMVKISYKENRPHRLLSMPVRLNDYLFGRYILVAIHLVIVLALVGGVVSLVYPELAEHVIFTHLPLLAMFGLALVSFMFIANNLKQSNMHMATQLLIGGVALFIVINMYFSAIVHIAVYIDPDPPRFLSPLVTIMSSLGGVGMFLVYMALSCSFIVLELYLFHNHRVKQV